jgi:hypothetical protein
VPRHPPYALNNLTTKMLASTVQFSKNNPTPTLHWKHLPSHHRDPGGLPPAWAGTCYFSSRDKHSRVPSGPNSVPHTAPVLPPRLPPFHAPDQVESSTRKHRRGASMRFSPVIPQFLEHPARPPQSGDNQPDTPHALRRVRVEVSCSLERR